MGESALTVSDSHRPAISFAPVALRLRPVDTQPVIDGLRNRNGLVDEYFARFLVVPPVDLDPPPFEIILETPQPATVARQVQAHLVILKAPPFFWAIEPASGQATCVNLH